MPRITFTASDVLPEPVVEVRPLRLLAKRTCMPWLTSNERLKSKSRVPNCLKVCVNPLKNHVREINHADSREKDETGRVKTVITSRMQTPVQNTTIANRTMRLHLSETKKRLLESRRIKWIIVRLQNVGHRNRAMAGNRSN